MTNFDKFFDVIDTPKFEEIIEDSDDAMNEALGE